MWSRRATAKPQMTDRNNGRNDHSSSHRQPFPTTNTDPRSLVRRYDDPHCQTWPIRIFRRFRTVRTREDACNATIRSSSTSFLERANHGAMFSPSLQGLRRRIVLHKGGGGLDRQSIMRLLMRSTICCPWRVPLALWRKLQSKHTPTMRRHSRYPALALPSWGPCCATGLGIPHS